MFFHGIDCQFVIKQYPVLSPRCHTYDKTGVQQADRQHLIRRFGFEPVHLLESNPVDYPAGECIRQCLRFGDTVFSFTRLLLPMWQLSRHEVGVPVLDLTSCHAIYTIDRRNIDILRELFPRTPLAIVKK